MQMLPLTPILRTLLSHPFREVVVDDQRRWKSYQLLIGSYHLARAIERSTQRQHIGVMLPTSGMFPMALIAGWMLGRVVVPLNYLLKRDDLEYVIRDAEIDTVVTVKPMLDFVDGLPRHINALRLEEVDFKGIPPFRRAARPSAEDLSVLLYTSGTSGRPKGVMLSHGNLMSNVMQARDFVDFTQQDSMLGVLPQFHSFGLTVLTLLPLSAGIRVCYTARFMPKRMLDLLESFQPTIFVAIPSMYSALLAAKSARPEHWTQLRYIVSGGEPLPESVAKGFQERFGVTINEGYGLTETAPVTNICRPWEYKPRSVGPCVPRLDLKIVDAEGRRLEQGEDGEVCFRGPNIMRGYFKLPDETAKAFDDEGYFRTGDMGRVDEDGHLYITGRIKEMLIIGGENVFPREIEEVLNQHEDVHASAVIGVSDESRGEVALAFVEIEEGAAFDEKALRAHCRAYLPQYKVPREIRLRHTLPRNPTGKIMRRELHVETPSEADADDAVGATSDG